MLWLKVKLGESVYVDGEKLTLVSKDRYSILVKFRGEHYSIDRNDRCPFPTFTLHAGDLSKGLRLGFEAPFNIAIRRESLETKLPPE